MLYVCKTPVRHIDRALKAAARPYPFGGGSGRAWVSFTMAEAWWPVLESVVRQLDTGRGPTIPGASRALISPHQVIYRNAETGDSFPWSPGKEETERKAYAAAHPDAALSAAVTLPINATVDVMMTLQAMWEQGEEHAFHMLDQWLEELGFRAACGRATALADLGRGRSCKPFTAQQAERAARDIGASLVRLGVTPETLAQGMDIEREHRDIGGCTAIVAARIALAHLRERADYYDRLAKYVER